jgi:NADH dehydrogenase [ubiquinone] 1 alpha subcomplex assembly factor 5
MQFVRKRFFSSSLIRFNNNNNNEPLIFNSLVKNIQRRNAIEYQKLDGKLGTYDYLQKEIAIRLVERLDDIDLKKRQFENILDLYSYSSLIVNELIPRYDKLGVKSIISAHSSKEFIDGCNINNNNNSNNVNNKNKNKNKIIPEKVILKSDEDLSCFKDNSFDLVISNLGLHWINNLPNILTSIKRVLKPDGLFIGTMFGGSTLQELRSAFLIAEQERDGGISPHISPVMQFQDGARLLQSTDFALTTVDVDPIEVRYPDVFALMHDLRCMGESNAHINSRFPVPRSTFMAMAAIYTHLYAKTSIKLSDTDNDNNNNNDDNKEKKKEKEEEIENEKSQLKGIPATFQIIYLAGWKPDILKQQQPLARASGKVSMIDALEQEQFFKVHSINDLIDSNDSSKTKPTDKK